MVSGGAEAIEIFAARGHFNYTDRQHIRQIANWFRSTGVTFHSMHSPMYADDDWGRSGAPVNIASVEKLQRVAATDEIKRAIEVAEQAPFQFLVQHVGIGNEEADEHKLDAAIGSLEHLHAFAKPLGVQLLVENITNELSTPEKLLELLHAGRFDDIGVCFDVGHAHIMSSVPQAFESVERPNPLDARARQQQRSRFASLAGSRHDRLEADDGAIAKLRRTCRRYCWRSRCGRREDRGEDGGGIRETGEGGGI